MLFKKHFNSDFEIQVEKISDFSINVAQYQTPIILDINDDCIPEIITAGYKTYNNDWLLQSNFSLDSKRRVFLKLFLLFISILAPILLLSKNTLEIIVAVADIDINPSNVRGKLVCYNFDNSIKWISDQTYEDLFFNSHRAHYH